MRLPRRLVVAVLVMPLLSGGRVASAAAPLPTRHPVRVMSLNQCTDQIVLALLPPARIASVTWLSRDPQTSLMAPTARKVGVNRGSAEEVLRQRPDLVIASSFQGGATRAILKRLGWPMIEVDDASSFDQIRHVARQIAAAVDERARGEVLIADMDRKLAALARDPGPPIRVAAWDGSGFGAEKGSLFDAVLRLDGAINVATEAPANGYGRPDTEVLLTAAPQLLIQGGFHREGLRANVANHPLVRRFWGKDRTLVIRQAYYLCGTPAIADAALALRAELRGALAEARTPLPFAGAAR